MKWLTQSLKMLVPLLLFTATCFADETYETYFLRIPNPADAPTVTISTSVSLSFTDGAITAIASNYSFKQFLLAFPNSANPNLDDVYLVEVNSPKFINDVMQYASTKYTEYEVANFVSNYVTITDPDYLPTVLQNNYSTSVTFTQTELNDAVADYTFRQFAKAFPLSSDPTKDNIYLVEAATAETMSGGGPFQLGNALSNYNNSIFTATVEAEYKKYWLTINDPVFMPTVSSGAGYFVVSNKSPQILTFSQSGVNAIVNNYNIRNFKQLFPTSWFKDLRDLYYLETNSDDLISDLVSYNNAIFPCASAAPEYISGSCPNPSDWGGAIGGADQKDFKLVKALDAWCESKGDSTKRFLGIVDKFVEFAHPDLLGKVDSLFHNDPKDMDPAHFHGTAVTGIAAGRSNNGSTGFASMGFHTKASVGSWGASTSPLPDQLVFQMAEKGVRVINNSWDYADITHTEAYSPSGPPVPSLLNFLPSEQSLYNQVFEYGSSSVFCAGNGQDWLTTNHYGDSAYRFPASFDNVISVTSIGSNVPYGSAGTHDFSVEDCHSKYPFESDANLRTWTHHHNPRVDICAPGYSNNILILDASFNATYGVGDGSSFATPMVSGTMALMLALKPCLSPYQLEYLLKASADSSLYSLAKNAGYRNPYRRLGTGRLDAGKAVQMTKTFNCNDPNTKSMYILKIGLNHACFGNSGNKIQLFPVVINQTPGSTLKYEWKALPGNTCTLNGSTNPEVTAATTNTNGEKILYYMLTVSEVGGTTGAYPPKSASKRIKVKLRNYGTDKWDLAMRDSYSDSYNEPNDMDIVDAKEWNYWLSPDLWNRVYKDDDTNSQNADYTPTDSNYVYVRVKNVGCLTSPPNKELHIYWTKSSTGEKWPEDWTTTNVQGVNGTEEGGREITPGITIPSLSMGQEVVLSRGWRPKDPAIYASGAVEVPACLLARIYDTSVGNHGLTETNGNVTTNVKTNNNIVTRNLQLGDYSKNNLVKIYQVDFANANNVATTFGLQLVHDKDIYKFFSGNVSEYLYAVVHLGDLFDIWQDGGGLGSYGVVDEGNKTITYDPSSPFTLSNITLDSGARYPIEVEFVLKEHTYRPDSINTMFHLRQMETDSAGKAQVYGNVSFTVAISADTDTAAHRMAPTYAAFKGLNASKVYMVYPNPVSKILSVQFRGKGSPVASIKILDVMGKTVLSEQNIPMNSIHAINTSTLAPGSYFVNIKDSQGENTTLKFVKVE